MKALQNDDQLLGAYAWFIGIDELMSGLREASQDPEITSADTNLEGLHSFEEMGKEIMASVEIIIDEYLVARA